MQGETVDQPTQSSDEQSTNNQTLNEQSARSEKIRQRYLDAMGIQTWYPRCQLSNALPPRPFDWIKEDAQALAASEKSTSVSENLVAPHLQKPPTDYSRTKPADILGQFMASATPAPAAQETRSIEEAAPEPAKPLSGSISKFRLVILPVSDECLVVAEMPHSGLNQFSRYHQRLLNDILRALKLSVDNANPFREFVWPISENRGLLSQLNQDDYAAADAVCAYLSNQYGLSRRKFVLLLGQSAARFVLDPEKNFEQLRSIQQGTHTDQWFAVTHGLNELMKQPVLKREAWQDLSPLLAITLSKTLPHSATSDWKSDQG